LSAAHANPSIDELSIAANGLTFHAAACGPRDGPLVLLLHGFPECALGWRHQLAALGAAGLRAVAPDQRGYGRTDKPIGVRAYAIDRLADDIVELASALGRRTFMLVGHDWGGIVAWHLASTRPAVLERLAILNAPHLGVAGRFARRHPLQLVKSAYVGYFQLPLGPELSLTSWDGRLLAGTLKQSSRPGAFSAEDLRDYRAAWTQPGAMTAMLNWYRAMALQPPTAANRITVPVRVIWGDRDSALEPGLAEESASLCDAVEVIHLPDATHWLHHEEIERVNALLLEFLRPRPAVRRTSAATA
jgi:pimeloyl-ACP methyl ester carboxylesterase